MPLITQQLTVIWLVGCDLAYTRILFASDSQVGQNPHAEATSKLLGAIVTIGKSELSIPVTSATKCPSWSSVTSTVTLYTVVSIVTPTFVDASSDIVYSYVPTESYVIASNVISPFALFVLLCNTFPSESFKLNVNSPSSKSFPSNVFVPLNCTSVSAALYVFAKSAPVPSALPFYCISP